MPPPVTATVPLAGWVTESIAIAPSSTSSSLASTSIAVDPLSSTTDSVSSTAVGASSAHVTLTATVALSPPGVSA